MDEAVDIAHAAIFNNHGQNCCAGSRTFVQAGIYDKFVAKAKAKAEGRKVGDPWTDVEQGPQVCVYYDVTLIVEFFKQLWTQFIGNKFRLNYLLSCICKNYQTKFES